MPNVFKPSYLKNCEQHSRMHCKFAADKSSMWVKLTDDNRTATHVKQPHAIKNGGHPNEKGYMVLSATVSTMILPKEALVLFHSTHPYFKFYGFLVVSQVVVLIRNVTM